MRDSGGTVPAAVPTGSPVPCHRGSGASQFGDLILHDSWQVVGEYPGSGYRPAVGVAMSVRNPVQLAADEPPVASIAGGPSPVGYPRCGSGPVGTVPPLAFTLWLVFPGRGSGSAVLGRHSAAAYELGRDGWVWARGRLRRHSSGWSCRWPSSRWSVPLSGWFVAGVGFSFGMGERT